MSNPESNSPENLRRLLTLIITDPETFAQCANGRQPVWEGAPGAPCEACGRATVSLARTWKLIDHACESCGHRWVAWEDAEAKAQWAKFGFGGASEPLTTAEAKKGLDSMVLASIGESIDKEVVDSFHTADDVATPSTHDVAADDPHVTRAMRMYDVARQNVTAAQRQEAKRLSDMVDLMREYFLGRLKSDMEIASKVVDTADTPLLTGGAYHPADPKYATAWTLIVDVLKHEFDVPHERRKKMADAIIKALACPASSFVVADDAPRTGPGFDVRGDGIPPGTIDHYASGGAVAETGFKRVFQDLGSMTTAIQNHLRRTNGRVLAYDDDASTRTVGFVVDGTRFHVPLTCIKHGEYEQDPIWSLLSAVNPPESMGTRFKRVGDAIIASVADSRKEAVTPLDGPRAVSAETRTRILGKVGDWDIWRTMSGVECCNCNTSHRFLWTLDQLRLIATGALWDLHRANLRLNLARQAIHLLRDEGGAGEARWPQPSLTMSYLGAFGEWDIWSNSVGVTCVSTGHKLLYWPMPALRNPITGDADLAAHALKLLAEAGTRNHALSEAGPG